MSNGPGCRTGSMGDRFRVGRAASRRIGVAMTDRFIDYQATSSRFQREFPRQFARVVQTPHPRISRCQSDSVRDRRVRRGLGTGHRIRFYARDGTQVLSAPAGRLAGVRSGRHRHDVSGKRLPGNGQRVRGGPAVDLHGRRHLLFEKLTAVHLYETRHPVPVEDCAVFVVHCGSGTALRVSGRAHGGGSRHRRCQRLLWRLPQSRFRQALPSRRPRLLRRRRSARPASERPRTVSRVLAQPGDARRRGDGAGRRLHVGGRTAKPSDRDRGRLGVHRVLRSHGARLASGPRRGNAHVRSDRATSLVRLWRTTPRTGSKGIGGFRRGRN